jgi:hypothetical protein
MLEVLAIDGRVLRVFKPAEAYPNQDLCLYAGPNGQPSFGIYRRDDPSLPARFRELRWQPAPYLEGVARVSIRTKETELEAAAGTLTVIADGGEGIVITDRLEALDRVASPHAGGGRNERAGGGRAPWRLKDVVAIAVDPESIEHVRLVNVAGATHTLSGEQLRSAAPLPTLKRNRRGQHHLRVFDGQRAVGELRNVVRIEVRTRAAR